MIGSLEIMSPTGGGENGFAPLSNGPSPRGEETRKLVEKHSFRCLKWQFVSHWLRYAIQLLIFLWTAPDPCLDSPHTSKEPSSAGTDEGSELEGVVLATVSDLASRTTGFESRHLRTPIKNNED